jgi:agmatine deiminase
MKRTISNIDAAATPELTPRELGFSMPAEWQPHAATWLAWPHNENDWPGKFAPIPWIYAEIVRLISGAASGGEKVCIFVTPRGHGKHLEEVGEILAKAGANISNVELIAQPTNRVWTRDSGPIFVRKDSQLAVTDWKFNAWAKYDDSAFDDALPCVVAGMLWMKSFRVMGLNDRGEYQRFVLEGGSIDVNGAGCLLTTEECLLSKVQQRNPGFSRERIEKTLCDNLGVEKILWLDRGIAGDDTHGHIDDTARFVAANRIVTCVESSKRDANFAAMQDNLRRLKKMRDAGGKQFEIVELPLPSPVVFDDQRLPASYANFYICNAGVLVPVFNDPADSAALKVLEACFKDRPVIPVYCRDLVWGLGTIHCMTQQQPK